MKKWQRQFIRELRETAMFDSRKLLCFNFAERREVTVSVEFKPPPTRVTAKYLHEIYLASPQPIGEVDFALLVHGLRAEGKIELLTGQESTKILTEGMRHGLRA